MSTGISFSFPRGPALPQAGLKLLLGAVLVGFVYYGYWKQSIGGTPCYFWLVGHWANVSNYSHGPLIPVIAAGLVWWKRDQFRAATLASSAAGVGVVALAMALYFAGVKGSQAHLVVISFVVLLYGLTLSLAGWEYFRLLFFPISFLFLMIPLNFLDGAIGFPLRMFVARAATLILNLIGIEAIQRGSGIISSVFRFDIADPCSGIRSLMALTTVTAAYAYVTQTVQWKRWFLFFCAIPLAVLGNLARVISIALFAQVYGQDLATKVYHDWSGYILFPVALTAMVITGYFLSFDFRRFFHHLLQPPTSGSHHE